MKIDKEKLFFENERFLLRMVEDKDCNDLLEVYSDKNALPFFNSDNCHGDIFYYNTKEKMIDAMAFWKQSYQNQWFTRLAIVEKSSLKVIGTVELCYRISEDDFNHMGILRLDIRSDYEKKDTIFNILLLIVPKAYDLLGCKEVITKGPNYAVERIRALQEFGFQKSEHLLIGGSDKTAYNGYWIIKEN